MCSVIFMIVHSTKLSVACFLLLGVALIFASGGSEAIDPEWSYDTGDNVYDVAISADGEYIAAGSTGYDNKLYLFDKDSSTPLWSYQAGNIVCSVAISADGEYVVAGSWDKKIYLFDKDSDIPLWHYTTNGALYSVAISADGEYIAAGNHDDEFYLFDKDSSIPLWTYSAGDAVYSVSISADGEYIAVGSFDGKVYLFDKDSSTPLWSYSLGGEVWSVSISADGEYIAAGGNGDKVYLFDKDSSTPIWNYDTGEDLLSVEISADGEYIVAGGVGDGWKVYFFDTGSSTPLWSYTAGNIVSSVDISANGDYVIAGSNDNKIHLFGKDSTNTSWAPLGNYTTGDDIYSVAISDSGQHIAAGSYDDKVYAFELDIETAPSEDPIVYWKFEEGMYDGNCCSMGGDIVYDSSGNGYDGQIMGGRDEWVEGINGSALRFEAGTDYVVLDDEREASLSSEKFTISMWFVWDDLDSNETQFLIGKEEEHYEIHTGENNRIMFIPAGYPETHIYVENVIHSGWNHVVVTYDTGWSRIYFDGDLVVSRNVSDSPHDLSEDDSPLLLGKRDGHSHGTFGGIMDEVAIWQRVLSSEEISELHDSYDIPVLIPPTVSGINITPNPAYSNERVYFTGENSSDTDGSIVGYEWMSDIDGFLSNWNEFSSVELSIGNHNISFRVKDDEGAWSNYIYESLVINQFDEEEPVYDCTDSNATNYNPDATIDDGGCEYEELGYGDFYYIHPDFNSSIEINEYYWDPSDGTILANMSSSGWAQLIDYEETRSILGTAKYTQHPLFRNNREPTQIATFTNISMVDSSSITINYAKFWWEAKGDEYEVDCEWTFDVFRNGDYLGNTTASCSSDGSALVGEIYNINITFPVNIGDMVEIIVWYEGWEDVDLFYGSTTHPSGFDISGLKPEEPEEEEPEEEGPSDSIIPSSITFELISTYDTEGAIGIALDGNYAYIADNLYGGLRVIDITDPYNPMEIGYQQTAGVTYSCVHIHLQFAYVCNGASGTYDGNFITSGLRIIDISNPNNPFEVGYINVASMPYEVEFLGNYAYVATNSKGLMIYDIADPYSSIELGGEIARFETESQARDIEISDSGFLYVADGMRGLKILDITDVFNLVEISSLDTSGTAYSLQLFGDFLIIADGVGGIEIVDISNPYSPILLEQSQNFTGEWWALDVSDGVVYGISYVLSESASITAFNPTNIPNLEELGTYKSDTNTQYFVDLTVSGDYVYLTKGEDGLYILKINRDYISEDAPNTGETEVSFSLPDNTLLYGLVTFTVGALIAAGLVEAGARNSIPQIVEGLQNLLDAGITDSEINEALLNLENVDGLNYFSEDRANALELLNSYESTTGSALDSMNQLNELQNLVNELEEAGVSSPELEAEIADIESMITSQLEGDTSKDYSKSVWERHRKD